MFYVKVISGKYKGRILRGYDLAGTRPTMDRVKESLFAMIQFEIEGKTVLDLFAGSGNLGIESLSRRALKSYLVDSNKKAISTIQKNMQDLKVEQDNYQILHKDYIKALEYFKGECISFDIIFLDPPYQTDYIEKSLSLIYQYNLLNDNGIIVCESDSLEKVFCDYYSVFKNKKYGDKYVVILKK